jgi:hypothetical protein
MSQSRKRALLASAAAAAVMGFVQNVDAAEVPVPITNSSTSTPISLAGFQGTAITLPPAFVTDATGGYAGTFTSGPGGSAYTGNNGVYAGFAAVGSTDPGFAARVSAGTSLHLTFAIVNNSGATLNGATLNFNEVQYQDAVATPNVITITSDDGTGTLITANTSANADPFLSGNTQFNEISAGGSTGTNYEFAAETLFYKAPILNGAEVQFEATFTPGGGGSRPIFGLADIAAVGSVPEPGTLSMLGAVGGLSLIRRRRRNI